MNPEPARHTRFVELIEQHERILLRIARAYAPNAADREDLVQETLAALWRSFASFDGRARFSTWMYRVALNVAISHARREEVRRRAAPARAGLLFEELPQREVAEPPAEAEALERAVARLPDLDKALVLLWLDGEPHAAIAETLGIGVSNVGTRLARLKARLAQELRGGARGNPR